MCCADWRKSRAFAFPVAVENNSLPSEEETRMVWSAGKNNRCALAFCVATVVTAAKTRRWNSRVPQLAGGGMCCVLME